MSIEVFNGESHIVNQASIDEISYGISRLLTKASWSIHWTVNSSNEFYVFNKEKWGKEWLVLPKN